MLENGVAKHLREVHGTPSEVMGSIRQEYFQSFTKRVVKILWAIIGIPIHRGFQGLTAQVDFAERFPL